MGKTIKSEMDYHTIDYNSTQPLAYTGINYRADPDNEPANVSRIVDLNKGESADGDDGAMALVQPYSTQDSGVSTNKNYDINGMFKLDLKSGMWQLSDEKIKSAIFEKMHNQYNWLTISNFDITIDRSSGIIKYEETNKVVSSNIPPLIIIKALDEKDFTETTFDKLTIDQQFYIDPLVMQAKYKAFYDNPQFKNVGGFTEDTIWVKKAEDKFCKLDKSKACIEAWIGMADVSVHANFKINVSLLENKNKDYYNYLSKMLGRESTIEDEFYKINANHYKLIGGDKDTMLVVNDPLGLPVLFTTWQVKIGVGDTIVENTMQLSKAPVGTKFYMTNVGIRDIYQKTVVPFTTMFIKVSDVAFVKYNGGKTDIDDYSDMDIKELMESWEHALDTREELQKELKKHQKALDRDSFTIRNDIAEEQNNWDTGMISGRSRIMVIKPQEFTQQKIPLNTVIDKLFNRYEITKRATGDQITLPFIYFLQAITKAHINPAEVKKLMESKEVQIPTGNGDETKMDLMEMGATDKYYWYIDKDDIVISKGQSK